MFVIHGSCKKRQLHNPQHEGEVCFYATEDDTERFSHICRAVMVHSNEVVLEFVQQSVVFKESKRPDVLPNEIVSIQKRYRHASFQTSTDLVDLLHLYARTQHLLQKFCTNDLNCLRNANPTGSCPPACERTPLYCAMHSSSRTPSREPAIFCCTFVVYCIV